MERLVQRNSHQRPRVQTERGVYKESPRKSGETVTHNVGGQRQQNLVCKGLGILLPKVLVHPLGEN